MEMPVEFVDSASKLGESERSWIPAALRNLIDSDCQILQSCLRNMLIARKRIAYSEGGAKGEEVWR